MSNDGDALIREVEEELRRDQLKKLWDNYGTYFIVAGALFIVAIAGYNWMESQRIAAAEAAGAKFEQAMSLRAASKTDEADKLLASLGSSGVAGYSALARLTEAGEAVKAGKTADALAAYETVAKTSGDPLIRDFASLQASSLKIESADWTEMQNRLKDLMIEKSPWRYSARELLGLAALRAGKLSEARQVLAPLSADPRAPGDARERASALMNLVVAGELEKTAPKSVVLEPAEGPPVAKPPPPQAAGDGGRALPSALDRLRNKKSQ